LGLDYPITTVAAAESKSAYAPRDSSSLRESHHRALTVIQALLSKQAILGRIAAEMTRALVAGKKVLWCGNGGSAADSQHLSAELVGRFRRERRGLASVALTADTSILTAIGNDYGYEEVFRRQVEALCVAGDRDFHFRRE